MSAAPTYDSAFAARVPDLATDDLTRQGWITARLASAWSRTSAEAWGGDREEATLLKVAHIYALRLEREERGATGRLKSVKIGKVSKTWADSSTGPRGGDKEDAYWSASSYGEEFIELRDLVCGSGPSWGIV